MNALYCKLYFRINTNIKAALLCHGAGVKRVAHGGSVICRERYWFDYRRKTASLEVLKDEQCFALWQCTVQLLCFTNCQQRICELLVFTCVTKQN